MSKPSLTNIPLDACTTHLEPRSIHHITNLLSPAECVSVIATHLNLVPSNITSGTVRDREVFDDGSLSSLLLERINPFFSDDKKQGTGRIAGRIVDEDGDTWLIERLNEKWRLCRYREGPSFSSPPLLSVLPQTDLTIPGGKFSPHCDGRRLASINEQSFLTINIYLNTVAEENGGATRFLFPPRAGKRGPDEIDILNPVVVEKARPVLGTAVLFRDDVWHDGEELTCSRGGDGEEVVKWLLRTDVMFRREIEIEGGLKAFETWCTGKGWGREEMGRKALAFAEGLEDAGFGEEAVVWYKRAERLAEGL